MTILKEILTKPIKEKGMIGDDASKKILDKIEEEKKIDKKRPKPLI